jgi:nucleoside 2-deoxyribosyltransferase
MYVYLAAPWIHKDQMKGIARKFVMAGHLVTHSWWLTEGEGYAGRTKEQLAGFALEDLNGVKEADKVVVISSAKSEGKAVEQGIALALGKPIIAVGKLGEFPNIFHYLPEYTWVETVEDAIEELSHVS